MISDHIALNSEISLAVINCTYSCSSCKDSWKYSQSKYN